MVIPARIYIKPVKADLVPSKNISVLIFSAEMFPLIDHAESWSVVKHLHSEQVVAELTL